MFEYANTPTDAPLKIHFIYVGQREIFCIFYDMLHNLCFIYCKISIYFTILSSCVQILCFSYVMH